jgi:hypothetical protein
MVTAGLPLLDPFSVSLSSLREKDERETPLGAKTAAGPAAQLLGRSLLIIICLHCWQHALNLARVQCSLLAVALQNKLSLAFLTSMACINFFYV